MTTKHRQRSRDMRLRLPEERSAYQTDDFLLGMYFGQGDWNRGARVYECANSHCLDRWIEAVPETTWLIGEQWFHFHYECAPKDGNLALEWAGQCGRCGTMIPLSGWGWRPVEGPGGFEQRMNVCPKCVTGWLAIRGTINGEGNVQDGGGVRGLVRGEQPRQHRLPARAR